MVTLKADVYTIQLHVWRSRVLVTGSIAVVTIQLEGPEVEFVRS